MGFRKRNAKRSDNRSSAKVIMGKPASKLTKEETSKHFFQVQSRVAVAFCDLVFS